MDDTAARRTFLGLAAAGLAAPALARRPASTAVRKDLPRMPAARPAQEPGFRPIFDGTSFSGWEGDPRYWRVENGVIKGEVTPATLLKSNTFLVWKGAVPENFELKAECRISREGNSGINYRSIVVPDEVTPANRFAMSGYQFDLDGRNLFTAMVYEERGRSFLARRGQFTRVVEEPAEIVGAIGEPAALRAAIKPDWNECHIVANGPALYHSLNGILMAAAIDDAPPRRRGRIGVQVHVGPPMTVEFRNIRLKPL